jgi:hypothetical protein
MRERACARDSFGQLISRPVHGVYAARAPDDGNLMPPNRHAAIGCEKQSAVESRTKKWRELSPRATHQWI